jgi:hypothetical protein
MASYSLPTAQIHDYLRLPCRFFQELAHDMFDGFHSEPIAAVYERCSSLRLFHEVTEEMGFIWIIQTLNTTLRDNAAVIGLTRVSRNSQNKAYNR